MWEMLTRFNSKRFELKLEGDRDEEKSLPD